MNALWLLIVCATAYFAFARIHEGADPLRAISEALLASLLFNGLLTAGAAWLSAPALNDLFEFALTLLAASLSAALAGAFLGGLKPRREPIAYW
jgi:hypothetical protein